MDKFDYITATIEEEKIRLCEVVTNAKADYIKICDECMLNEEYCKLLEMKIKGYSRTKMAMELNVSEPTLDIMIKKLKKKIRKIL